MNKLKHFFMLTFSTLLIAFGTYFFKFTNNFTFGGITGLAVLIAKTGLISAGDFNFIASMILLIIGMFILGKKFAATTAYCSILLSVSLSVLERLFPMHSPFTDEPMLELCFAIALPALGSAILFRIFQRRNRYHRNDPEKIFQLRHRQGIIDFRCIDNGIRIFYFRYRNRTVFPARTFYSFFHDRHIYRKL